MKNATSISYKETAKSLCMHAPEDLEKTLNSVKEAYKAGLITSDDVDRFLLDFKFRDSTLRYWTIGIQTGKWYCSINSNWVNFPRPDQPLEAIADLSLTSYVKEVPIPQVKYIQEQVQPLPPPPPDSGISARPNQTPTELGTKRFCCHCGNPITAKMVFCDKCGDKL